MADKERLRLAKGVDCADPAGYYSVLAGCQAFIYCNARAPEFTHYLVIVTIVAVAVMTLLDCRVSDDDWKNWRKSPKRPTSLSGRCCSGVIL